MSVQGSLVLYLFCLCIPRGKINKVLGNLVQTYNPHEIYVDDADPWTGILAAAAFLYAPRTTRLKVKIRSN